MQSQQYERNGLTSIHTSNNRVHKGGATPPPHITIQAY